jgi:Ca2+-binding EF-hand superfamily protein
VTKLLWFVAAVALLALPNAIRGEETSAPDSAGLFKQLDANGDGQLAGDEVPEEKKSLFERLVRLGDGDADGKLSAEEFATGLAGGEQPAAKGPRAKGETDAPKKPAKATPGRPGKAERPGPGRLFARLDANGDGKVELDEVPEERRPMFEKVIARNDKNGDQALSLEEFSAESPVRMVSTGDAPRDPAIMFKRLDANADGKVVADEAPEPRREMITKMIERADKDGDAALSLEEFTVVMNRIRPADAKPEGDAKEDSKSEAKAKPADSTETKSATEDDKKSKKKAAKQAAKKGMPSELFSVLDEDHNGQLDQGEISGSPAALAKLDKDGDGKLSIQEASMTPRKKKKNKS